MLEVSDLKDQSARDVQEKGPGKTASLPPSLGSRLFYHNVYAGRRSQARTEADASFACGVQGSVPACHDVVMLGNPVSNCESRSLWL